MIFDLQAIWSDQPADIRNTGTYYSDYIIDLKNLYGTSKLLDIAQGNPIELFIGVTDAFTSGGAATLAVTLLTDDNAPSGGSLPSANTIWSFATAAGVEAIPYTDLVKGYRFPMSILPPGLAYPRYLQLKYVVGTANITAGKITAGIVKGLQTPVGKVF